MTVPPQRRPAGEVPVSRQNRKRETPAPGIPTCEFCGAKVIWAYPTPSTKGRGTKEPPKPKPLDYEADDNGRYTLYRQGDRVFYGELTKGQAPGYRAAGNETYQAHFKSCPKAGDWGKLGKPYGQKQVNR